MALDHTATVVVERPIGEVAAYAGDPSNAAEWHRHVSSAEWETDPPTRLGSRVRVTARVFGREFAYLFEITEWTPGEQVAMRTVGGPFPIDVVSTWRPVGDRVTHMTLRYHGRPRGAARLLTPLVTRLLRRATSDDLDELTRRLER